MERGNVLVCASGSVAAVKLRAVVDALSPQDEAGVPPRASEGGGDGGVAGGLQVKVVVSEHAKRFVDTPDLERRCGRVAPGASTRAFHEESNVFYDADEWDSFGAIGDPVLHIELAKVGSVP